MRNGRRYGVASSRRTGDGEKGDIGEMDTLSRTDLSGISGAPEITRRRQPRRALAPSAPVAAQPTPVTLAITIERLILHHLDNRTGDLLLVEAELALDDAIRALFASYIAEAHQNADWQARFSADESATPTMPDLCAQLLREPAAFVAISQTMARRLFDQMRQRPNQINPGDFVVAIYSAPTLPTACIALFKRDPDERLVRDFSLVHGRRLARIALADNLLPQTVRLKQKCALITPATDDWLAAHGAALPPRALMDFYAARRASLAGETLDLPAFALAALPTDGALAADLLAWLVSQIFDAEFEPQQTRFMVDRATADPVVRYVTLELDGGARLRIPAERFAEMARVDGQRVGGKIRLTIETLTLKEGTAQ